MLRSRITWLIPLAFTLVGFGSSIKSATAQTTYEFDTFYDIEVILTPITPEVSQASISGFNPDAPYGLTNFSSINYSQFNPATGVFTFVPDAAQFGLEGLPVGVDRFFGSGDDQLFATSNATAAINFTSGILEGSGTVTITGGAGRFSGATGVLNFFETEPLDQDPTAPLRGQAFLSGSFQTPRTVPEPTATTTLIGIGVTGAGFLLRQRRLLSAGKS
jgi:hypothetical protein